MPRVKKVTMVHAVVGKVRSPCYDLPASDHVYGKKGVKDPESAGQVLSRWDVAKPSKATTCDRNLIKTNALAIESGNLTAKEMRDFAKAHPDIRFKPPSSRLRNEDGTVKKEKIPHNGPFGLPTAKDSTSLKTLIEGRFTDFTNTEADYPSVEVLKKRYTLPPARETKASTGHSIRSHPPVQEKKRFTMKKFQDVPSRFAAPVCT